MHILFLAPYFNQPRGNSTTIKRLVHFLDKQDVNLSVIPYLENDNWFCSEPDIYHILHATRYLQWAKETHFRLNRPYIVTMGGTDINIDLQKGVTEDIFTFLQGAAYITVFTEDAKRKVIQLDPKWEDKTRVIPQGIWLPWTISKKWDELDPHILLPAGLRRVKDVLHVIPALDQLIVQYPMMKYTILGANLDERVKQEVHKKTEKRPWMNYAGVVPYEVMKVWYEQAQIIINTSQSEGQSLAVMEAMAMGKPVIARKNEANLQLVTHETTGWLYESMDEFKHAIHSIIHNPSLRESVVEKARQWIVEHYSPEKEVQTYYQLYKTIYY
ncbi:glycosyltransferase [Bacillus tuaregi]|uniref:glycosyltransferase n=1 Tax=Bacillus tuaregi TaxID=1816695 RepID=UPI0008F8BFBF|nr:glycosyltransferase [Bacillus tuaregi]